MIKEDYVSFEIAKLLKEKGFPFPSTNFEDWVCCMYDENQNIHWGSYDKNWYFRITHQMAMKWLREVHNIFIVIEPHMYDYINEKNSSYVTSLWQGDNYYENITSKDYPAYEEAVEATLKYALENLI